VDVDRRRAVVKAYQIFSWGGTVYNPHPIFICRDLLFKPWLLICVMQQCKWITTVSGNFMTLIKTKFGKSWSVLNWGGRCRILCLLGRHLGFLRPWIGSCKGANWIKLTGPRVQYIGVFWTRCWAWATVSFLDLVVLSAGTSSKYSLGLAALVFLNVQVVVGCTR
jgi:hypothetical protein